MARVKEIRPSSPFLRGRKAFFTRWCKVSLKRSFWASRPYGICLRVFDSRRDSETTLPSCETSPTWAGGVSGSVTVESLGDIGHVSKHGPRSIA